MYKWCDFAKFNSNTGWVAEDGRLTHITKDDNSWSRGEGRQFLVQKRLEVGNTTPHGTTAHNTYLFLPPVSHP